MGRWRLHLWVHFLLPVATISSVSPVLSIQHHLIDLSVSFVLWRWHLWLCLDWRHSPTHGSPNLQQSHLQLSHPLPSWSADGNGSPTVDWLFRILCYFWMLISWSSIIVLTSSSLWVPAYGISPSSTLFLTNWTPAPSCEEISDGLSGCSRTESQVHIQLCGTSYACRLSLATMLASSTPHNSLQWKCSSESIQSRHISQILQLLPHSLIRSHNPCHRQPESSNGQMQCWYSRVAVLLQASKGQMKSERGDFIKQIFVWHYFFFFLYDCFRSAGLSPGI